jgi:cell division septation protein DedD
MAAKKRKHSEQAPGWAWMLFGLSIGLAVALVVYLKDVTPGGRISRPFASVSGQAATVTAGGTLQPAPAPGSTADAAPAVPTATFAATANANPDAANGNDAAGGLSFYDRLPQLGVAVPEADSSGDRDRIVASGAYRIQAGAFQTYAEADSRSARLALLGIAANVESAIVNDRLWHRVIIGPLTEIAEINRVRNKLREQRIDALEPQLVSD